MKLWDKGTPLNKQIEAFTVGDDPVLDLQLLRYDCMASAAHAKMLGKIGVLTSAEVDALVAELAAIQTLAEQDKFVIRQEDEDCHTAIEAHLIKKLGDLGKKIHTGRSRNDQVLTALRLLYKDRLHTCREQMDHLIEAVAAWIKKYPDVRFPGWTHTRKAMPSSAALWGGSLVDAMTDNKLLVEGAFQLIDQNPLGTGAGYGIPLPLDRDFTTKELGFSRTQANAIYAQNSRIKFEATILHALTQIMFDLNKTATDLIFFSMPEFGFVALPDEFCTGSSIMPQKKNPDVLELVRARYHQVVAYEFQIKSLAGNLISGYHRDVQLSKEPVLRALDITLSSLSITALVFRELRVNPESCKAAMTDELFATEEAYALVQSGMPFREAYQRIAKKYQNS